MQFVLLVPKSCFLENFPSYPSFPVLYYYYILTHSPLWQNWPSKSTIEQSQIGPASVDRQRPPFRQGSRCEHASTALERTPCEEKHGSGWDILQRGPQFLRKRHSHWGTLWQKKDAIVETPYNTIVETPYNRNYWDILQSLTPCMYL